MVPIKHTFVFECFSRNVRDWNDFTLDFFLLLVLLSSEFEDEDDVTCEQNALVFRSANFCMT